MKTKSYYFAIILMANFSFCFGQKNSNDLYNLFYLSKMMANDKLGLEERNETYFALKANINESSLDKINATQNKNIYDFVNKIQNDNLTIVATWLEDPENFKKKHKEILEKKSEKTKTTLLENFTNIVKMKNENEILESKIKKIETVKSNLEEEYVTASFDTLKKNNKDFKSLLSKYYNYNTEEDNYKIISLELLKNKLLSDNLQIEDIADHISNLKNKYSETEFNSILEILRVNISIYYYKDEKNDFCFKNLENLKKEIQDSIVSKLVEEHKRKNIRLIAEVGDFKLEFVTIFLKNNSEEYDKISKIVNTSNFSVSKEQQIIINSQIQTAQAQTGSSGIKIPSQSQMIEAMAIFLAKRAKQEAAIWFIDQIRLKMNNPMILDVFPATIKVMDGAENYKVPTFNTTWKYAIAKDFVEMPKNLVDSPWVENVIFKEDKESHAFLKQSVEFSYDLNRLMTEQYNYRDIIKYFYINPRAEEKEKQELNKLINKSTTLLYIITNEFFALENIEGKDTYRLLSYEEIVGLNDQEYQTLLELIDLKYGEKLDEFKIIETFKSQKQEAHKWIGNILISLSQFDKIRNDYQTKKDEIKDDLASKNFYNIWSVLNQMTKNLHNEKLFTSSKIKNIKNKIEWVEKGMSIYEHFQSNDYVGAANQTFELMNMIKQSNHNPQEQQKYFYNFGKDEKISITVYQNCFIIKNENNQGELEIKFVDSKIFFSKYDSKGIQHVYFDNEKFKELISVAKYISKNDKKNLKLLDEILGVDNSATMTKLINFSESINVEKTELFRLLSYINLAQELKTQNLKEVFNKNGVDFIKQESTKVINKYNYKYTKQLTNLLSFFGDVMTVKDEHQLAGIIDSYALPPTSYKLKRKQPSSIDLNAYVGAFGGGLMSLKSSTIGSQAVYGITAPIGVAFTWSRNGWYDNYGFTVDVVDLGNVVNHYLVKPGEDYAKDVHFSEVFSLGTTFLLGIKNSPFVLSGGFRFQPFNTGKDQNNKVFDAGIFHLGVKIDIPLIHLSGKEF